MILYPAIDLYKGKIVRLKQGDFNQRTDYALAPITAAKAFLRAGSSWVHIIDLEGAQARHPAHLQVIEPLKNLGLWFNTEEACGLFKMWKKVLERVPIVYM